MKKTQAAPAAAWSPTPAWADEVMHALERVYPDSACALEWGGQTCRDKESAREQLRRDSWKLLVMARLSAQCTDARVNIVCRELFDKYPTCAALAEAPLADIETIIRPCGLYHGKAVSIKDSCTILVRDYDGIVPDSMEALLALPGVGRKIANLLLGDVYGQPGVVTDTHCIRICGRLGFYDEALKDPARVERILTPLLRPEGQSEFCHRLVQFGRDVCTARSPACGKCPLSGLCRHSRQETPNPGTAAAMG